MLGVVYVLFARVSKVWEGPVDRDSLEGPPCLDFCIPCIPFVLQLECLRQNKGEDGTKFATAKRGFSLYMGVRTLQAFYSLNRKPRGDFK